MLPLCSATPCSFHSQVFLSDAFSHFYRPEKALYIRCLSGDTTVSSFSTGACLPGVSAKNGVADVLYSDFLGKNVTLPNQWQHVTGNLTNYFFVGNEHLKYVEDSMRVGSQEEFIGDSLLDNTDKLPEPSTNESITFPDQVSEGSAGVSDSVGGGVDAVLTSNGGFEDVRSKMDNSVEASASKVKDALHSSLDQVISTMNGIIKDSNEFLESTSSRVFSSVDQSGEVARNKLVEIPSNLKQASGKAGVIALDLLRKTIILVEDSLVKGSKLFYYSYQSSKELLPPEIQDAIISLEKAASDISRPITMIFVQVYSTIEGVERSLGFDSSDPLVPFFLLLGTASTLWAVYWVVTYSGYAGDLSPKLAFELLSGRDNAVLIDARPEELRERDGVPDLRRTARSRYASVSLPEVDSSLTKLMKSSKDLDDALVATVIRNLKNVRDSSKIIVMDANGGRAKGIARSLKKFGIKRPYILHGGFQSWVKDGLRVKELKPETAFTILNEEAEAILEELKPTPVQLFTVCVGSVAALYALVEWEKTLQFIGVIGLGQSIFRRLASYEDAEDIMKDVSWLLSPVRYGAQAVSLAVGKAEGNGNGLPLSPSSSDVQSRVLQAAAKHESQPFDEVGGSQPVSTNTATENVDPSEA